MFSARTILSLALVAVAGVSASTRTTHIGRSIEANVHDSRSLYEANNFQKFSRRRSAKRQATDNTKADTLAVNLNAELAPLLSQIQATVALATPLNGAQTGLTLTGLLSAVNANIQASIDLAAAIPTTPTPSTTGTAVDCTTVAQVVGDTVTDVGTSIASIESLYSTIAGLEGVVSGAVGDTETELTMLIGQLSVILNCLVGVLQTTLNPVLPQLGTLGTTLGTVLGL